MKNIILSSLFIAFFTCSLSMRSTAQDSMTSHVETNSVTHEDGKITSLVITETETDNSYRLSCKFDKPKTEEIRRYLHSYLGHHDQEVGNVRQVWKHLPDGATIEGLEITLRESKFTIKAKEGCCPGDMEELKAIGEDIKTILE